MTDSTDGTHDSLTGRPRSIPEGLSEVAGGPDDAAEAGEPAEAGESGRTTWSAVRGALTEVVVVVALALGLSLLIKTFLVQAFFIPSESMENTLLVGDRVLVSKLTPGPFALHRGDVVVFKDPGGWLPQVVAPNDGTFQAAVRNTLTFVGLLPQDSGEHLVKRVIGLPGDTVKCCDAQKRLQVNGVSVDEPYLFPQDAPSTTEFSVTVPAGSLWVMGDHRSDSRDSRFHLDVNHGMVPMSDVVGTVFVIVWPPGRTGGIGGSIPLAITPQGTTPDVGAARVSAPGQEDSA